MPSLAALNLSSSELTLRLSQQELVAEFGRFALRTDSFQAILDRACAVAALGLEAGFAKVLEYLPGEGALLVRAGVGWKDGVVGQARLRDDLQSPAGYAFRTGKPVVSNHLASEQRFRTPVLLAEHGIRSAINVLIASDDAAPFGVLEGDSTHRGEFGEHDVAFLQALANMLAVAVEAQKRQDARAEALREKDALLRENQILLREKDLLMQEVHHRVANSLQLVHGILTLQTNTLTSPEAKLPLQEAGRRIITIAAVHRRLYQGGSVAAAEVEPYLRGLLADMRGLLLDETDERLLELEVHSFSLSAEDLTQLGLIISELVTNALKHGAGKIRIEVQRKATGLIVSVSDEGEGFPVDFDPAARRGLGMRLVRGLAKGPSDAIVIDRSVPSGRIIVQTGFGGEN